jgi:hypothetical protein
LIAALEYFGPGSSFEVMRRSIDAVALAVR